MLLPTDILASHPNLAAAKVVVPTERKLNFRVEFLHILLTQTTAGRWPSNPIIKAAPLPTSFNFMHKQKLLPKLGHGKARARVLSWAVLFISEARSVLRIFLRMRLFAYKYICMYI